LNSLLKANFLTKSVWSQLLLVCGGVIASCLLIATLLQFWLSWQDTEDLKKVTLKEVQDFYIPLIAHQYWHLDASYMQSLLAVLHAKPFLAQVKLIASDQTQYALGEDIALENQDSHAFELTTRPASASNFPHYSLFPRQRGFIIQQSVPTQIQLKLVFDRQQMQSYRLTHFFKRVSQQILWALLISSVLCAGFFWFLIRPIRLLVQRLTRFESILDVKSLNNSSGQEIIDNRDIQRLRMAINRLGGLAEQYSTQQTLLKNHGNTARLNLLFELLDDGVVVTDLDFNIRFANQNAVSIPLPSNRLRQGESLRSILNQDATSLVFNADFQAALAISDIRGVTTDLVFQSLQGTEQHFTLRGALFAGEEQLYVFLLSDVTEYKRLFSEIEQLATHDALTNTLNRASFKNKIQMYLKSRSRLHLIPDRIGPSKTAVLLYINVDYFKIVNDSVGRIAGDELLRQVSQILQSLIADPDFVARLEGDVFAVVCHVASRREAQAKANALCLGIAGYEFFWGHQKFSISISIGAVLLPCDAKNTDELLRYAHKSCQVAKRQGRQKVVFFSADLESQLNGDQQGAANLLVLERAIETQNLKLFLQPIVEINNQCPIPSYFGPDIPVLTPQVYELLVRIEQPDGSLLFPSQFLSSAEYYNKITLVDRYVIDRLFEYISLNPVWFSSLAHISINISGPSLTEEFMLGYVAPKAVSLGIEPKRLCFEVTETAAIADLKRTIELMTILGERGFQFSLDDFGSGLASYGYLQQLPVHYLKIDGSFIRQICESPVNAKLVASINTVAHQLGLKTIAEYVENEHILSEVTKLSVDYAQGYVYGRAIPIESYLTQQLEETVCES